MAGKKRPSGNRRKSTPKKGLRKPTARKPVWIPAFLTAFRKCGIVTSACEAAGIDRTTVYAHREKDPDFGAAWEESREAAIDYLESEARRRAERGVARLKFHQGDLIRIPGVNPDGSPMLDDKGQAVMVPYVEHEYSDTLLIFLMKGARPEKYRDNVKQEISGPDGKPIEVKDGTPAGVVGQVHILAAALLSAASREQGGTAPADGLPKPVRT